MRNQYDIYFFIKALKRFTWSVIQVKFKTVCLNFVVISLQGTKQANSRGITMTMANVAWRFSPGPREGLRCSSSFVHHVSHDFLKTTKQDSCFITSFLGIQKYLGRKKKQPGTDFLSHSLVYKQLGCPWHQWRQTTWGLSSMDRPTAPGLTIKPGCLTKKIFANCYSKGNLPQWNR